MATKGWATHRLNRIGAIIGTWGALLILWAIVGEPTFLGYAVGFTFAAIFLK